MICVYIRKKPIQFGKYNLTEKSWLNIGGLMPEQKYYALPQELGVEILKYLVNRPYIEAEVIGPLVEGLKSLQPVEIPKPEDTTEEDTSGQ
jgi:hypothetical protein